MRNSFYGILLLSILIVFSSCSNENEQNSSNINFLEEDSTIEISTNISVDLSYRANDTIIFPGSNGECEGTFFHDFRSESETNSQFDTLDFKSLTSSVAHLKNNGTFLSVYLLTKLQTDKFISSNYESPIMKSGEFGIRLNLFNESNLPLGIYSSSNEFAKQTAKLWIITEREGNQVSSSLITDDIEVNLFSLTETEACGSFESKHGHTKFTGSFNAYVDYIDPIE